MTARARLTFASWAKPLRWLDKRPLLATVEPYRLQHFAAFFDERDEAGRPRCNVSLSGRGKKNFKSGDAVLAALRAVSEDSTAGSQVYLVANDKDQARDDLVLAEKVVRANPLLLERLKISKNVIERKDGRGFIEVLPAQDAVGAHGKTFRLVVFDEIHGYRTWDLFEALAFDPTRPEAQWWITSYASLYHKPGVPLHDLMQMGKGGQDARMLFSWYAADFTTDAALKDATPEHRANPSMASWGNDEYLDAQRRLLPSHKFRRLHLNLPGLPEGSAFQPEPISDAIARGTAARLREAGRAYRAFVDMSGGSSDDAVLAIGHVDDGRAVLDRLVDQGAPAPFDPNKAVTRFAAVLAEFGLSSVTGDAYAGQTFRVQFEAAGIAYQVCDKTRSALYEALEPKLNARALVLVDVPLLEQQLLGLVWRGGKIDHPAGEHDDYANAAAGVVDALLGLAIVPFELYGGFSGSSDTTKTAQQLRDEADAEDKARAEESAREILAAIASSGAYFPGAPTRVYEGDHQPAIEETRLFYSRMRGH